MDVTPLISSNQKVIQSYGKGTIKISGQVYTTPVLVYPDRVEIWDVSQTDPEQFTAKDFGQIAKNAQDVDVILFGCGDGMIFIKPDLRAALKVDSLNIEAMDTGAACRTYNVLMAEGRRLVAALLPVSK